MTQRPPEGGDDNAFPCCALAAAARWLGWVSFAERKWVNSGARRGLEPTWGIFRLIVSFTAVPCGQGPGHGGMLTFLNEIGSTAPRSTLSQSTGASSSTDDATR